MYLALARVGSPGSTTYELKLPVMSVHIVNGWTTVLVWGIPGIWYIFLSRKGTVAANREPGSGTWYPYK